MEIHKPHAAKSWKEFVIELGTIVIGILIALRLEQMVEGFHDRSRVAQARENTDLPGRPCVLVNTHPVKNAGPDNLVPRGGSAFLNEMDGNLCCRLTGDKVDMHWLGKFRGPDFQPVSFQLVPVTSPKLVDTKGRPLPTVYAKPLTDYESAAREDAASRDQVKVLVAMFDNEGASIANLAEALKWISPGGKPMKSKVHRVLRDLQKQKLAKTELNKWRLTPAGEKAAKKHAPSDDS